MGHESVGAGVAIRAAPCLSLSFNVEHAAVVHEAVQDRSAHGGVALIFTPVLHHAV